MTRRAGSPGELGAIGPIRAVLVGLLVALLLTASLLVPGSPSAPLSRAPRITPPTAEVDPEFLPTTLFSPNPNVSGNFGQGTALTGNTAVIGAPGEYWCSGGLCYSGRVYVFNESTASTVTIPDPAGRPPCLCISPGFGSAVAIGDGRIVVGAPGGGPGAHGIVYVYSSSTYALLTSYTSPTPAPGEGFGTSVSVSGNWIAIGSPLEIAGGLSQAGRVYLINTQTSQEFVLSSPSPVLSGQFGCSVSVSGNLVAVGARLEGVSTTGMAYVFTISTGDLLSTWENPNPWAAGLFGYSVSLSGTLLAAGAPGNTVAGLLAAGNAYVINLATGTVVTVSSPVPATGGDLGLSVSVDSSTVLVGAPGEPSGGNLSAGNAYDFSVISGALISSTFSPPFHPSFGDFGGAVAETSTSALIGAPDENVSSDSTAGEAFWYSRVPLTVASPQAVSGGRFGWSVSVSGAVLIGAPYEPVASKSYAGHAYLVPTHAGPVLTLTSPTSQVDDLFGYSVAVAGSTAAVSALEENTSVNYSGAAYVFNASTGSLVSALKSPNPLSFGYFGYSIATNGNWVAVGAPGETAASLATAGNVYIYYANNGTLYTTLISPHAQGGGAFGQAVAMSGTWVVVGAPGENGSGGAAYAFNLAGGPHPVGKALVDPSAHSYTFGASVAIAGTTVVVGAPLESTPATTESGVAYVYSVTTGALLFKLVSQYPTFLGEFGASVALNAATIVVGAPWETAWGTVESGNAYLFSPVNGAPLDRYNNPNPSEPGLFGQSAAIGPGGVVVVGAPQFGPGNAFVFFL